ncbi:hypothetical protein [Streptomyces sp. NPDC050704]|uniref:hypothetical protein n=1 Tax=Streptomyces sp. NPDC050704 TaxID=3157219 RepID=UPI00344297E9
MAAEELTPVDVTTRTSGAGTPCWMVTYQLADGRMHGHAFPQETLEWRVAEYGLDTIDEALDVVLHEPWAITPSEVWLIPADAATRQGMVIRARGPVVDYEPIVLRNADSIEDARTAHRMRIADAKTRVHVVPPKGKPDPLDVIRQRHGVTGEGVQEKAALVDAVRRAERGEAPAPQPDIILDPDARRRRIEITSV